MKQETRRKKIKELESKIKMVDDNSMITIRIFGIMKKKITKIQEVPIDNKLQINEYLFRGKKEKKDFIDSIRNKFPKGSIINVEEIDKLAGKDLI